MNEQPILTNMEMPKSMPQQIYTIPVCAGWWWDCDTSMWTNVYRDPSKALIVNIRDPYDDRVLPTNALDLETGRWWGPWTEAPQ